MRVRSFGHRLRLRGWQLTHRGTDRQCPACGLQIGEFAPYGVARRRDAQCPRCGSLERHRALALYVTEHPELDASNGRVLAIAPDSHLEKRGRRNPDYLSIDLAPGRAMQTMDLERLDLPDEDRDLVIAYHVLEHIRNDARAMLEIARVLRPAGTAILEVPLRGDETDERFADAPAEVRAREYDQADHVRMYGRADFEGRLRRAGLSATAVHVGEAFRTEVEHAALNPDEIFHVARRTLA